jgi:phosphoglycolate phosphatase-like HAD superfamily hydrolase
LKLVLFDIDGTLLLTSGAGRRAVMRALLDSVGATGSFDGIRFDGKTDPQIVRELLTMAGHPEPDQPRAIEDVCTRYVGLLEAELAAATGRVQLLDGVAELLDALEPRSDVVLGLLTGNLEPGARLKLTSAGLDPERFRVGAYGSDAADRSALPDYAARRASGVMGIEPSGDAMVIIGDTPADMTCGRSRRARAIGVATGSYSPSQLSDAGAYAVFDSLIDVDSVVSAIFA